MTFATLEFNGEEKSFGDLGMIQILHQVGRGDNFFGFNIEGEPCDGDALWAYADEVIIRRARISLKGVVNTFSGGATVFVGRRVKNVRFGSAQFEGLTYQFSGPWYYLTNNIFQMVAKTYNNATHALEDIYLSDLWMCQNLGGGKIATDEQLTEIVNYVKALTVEQFGSAKLQAGAGFPAINAPVDQVRDIVAGEAIGKMIRWAPDSAVWFDFSTTPPTLNIKKRADLVAVDLPMAADAADAIEISSREDLLRPSVHFKYRQTTSENGQNFVQTFHDIAPVGATGREDGALPLTFDFDGGSVTQQTSKIECEAIQVENIEWWKARHPDLNSDKISGLAIKSGTEVGPPAGFPNELKNGQVTEWMNGHVQEATVRCTISFIVKDGTSTGRKAFKDLTWSPRCTDLNSGVYKRLTTDSLGEPLPFGLAAQFLASINVLHYEGTKTITEREVSYAIGVGNVLNISGGRPEWATMRALVQAVSYDWDNGKTTVTFGPAANLSPADLVELSRVNRNRWVMNYSLRQTAQSGAGDSQLGQDIPKASGSALTSSISYQMFFDSAHPTNKVIIDVSKAAGKTIEIIELPICIGGVSKKILVLASEPFT